MSQQNFLNQAVTSDGYSHSLNTVYDFFLWRPASLNALFLLIGRVQEVPRSEKTVQIEHRLINMVKQSVCVFKPFDSFIVF